jgi:hypothetical protein
LMMAQFVLLAQTIFSISQIARCKSSVCLYVYGKQKDHK